MDVQMPDGTLVQGVPNGVTQSQLLAKYSKYQAIQSGPTFPDKPQVNQPQSMIQDFGSGVMRGAGNAVLGMAQLTGTEGLLGGTKEDAANAVQQLKDESQNRGWSGLAGELTGDPRNWLGSLLPGGLAARTLEGAAYGATDPSTQKTWQGQLEDKGVNAAEDAAIFAAVPALASKAIKGAGTFATGVIARSGGALDDAIDEMKNTARSSYKTSEDAGAVFTPNAANKVSSALDSIVPDQGTRASQKLYSKTLDAISGLKEDVANGDVSLQTLDRHRQILGNIAKDITNPNRAQEAEMASRGVSAIDDFVDNVDPKIDIVNQSPDAIDALNQGRQQWAQAKKFEKVSDIVKRADGDPKKLQMGFQKFIQKRGNLRGFTDDEIGTLKAAANNSLNDRILRGLQSFGLRPEHLLSSLVGPGVVAKYVSEPLGMALGGLGTIARPVAKNLAKGRAERVLQTIEK